jgi:hypothetical protein
VQRSPGHLIQALHKQPSHDVKLKNGQPMDRGTYHRARRLFGCSTKNPGTVPGFFSFLSFVGFVQRSPGHLIQALHKQPSHDVKSKNGQPMDRGTYHRALGLFGCSTNNPGTVLRFFSFLSFVGFVQRSPGHLIQASHKQPSHDIKSKNGQSMDRVTYLSWITGTWNPSPQGWRKTRGLSPVFSVSCRS